MSKPPFHRYGGHAILINPFKTPRDRFFAEFSIQKGMGPDVGEVVLGKTVQQGPDGEGYLTEAEAINGVLQYAQEWIGSHSKSEPND
jgi:hypothetical protein